MSSSLFSFKFRLPSFRLSKRGERGRRASSAEPPSPPEGQGPERSPSPFCEACQKARRKACKCRKGKKGLNKKDPRRHSHAGGPDASTPRDLFEDEADLFEGHPGPPQGSSGQDSNANSLSDEDAGVCVAESVNSLSPTPSAERNRLQAPRSAIKGSSVRGTPRPLSCTFGNLEAPRTGFNKAKFLEPNQGNQNTAMNGYRPQTEMSSFQYRPSFSTLLDPESVCPTCQMCFDNSTRRKLVDGNCGHARCFKCMFKTNECPLCICQPQEIAYITNNQVKSEMRNSYHHPKKPASLSGRATDNEDFRFTPTAFLPGSLHSRESGFQSFASSMTSVCSKFQGISLQQETWSQDNDMEDENDDCISMVSGFDRRSVASGTSFISLMSGQSSLRYPATDQGFSRNDNKRHSLSSFKRPRSETGNGISGRNSAMRRSAILTRSSKMSSIEENKRTPDDNYVNANNYTNLTSLLRPLFFEVPKSPVFSHRIFVGRKWLFREILEHLSSDLPTSRGMVIHGGSTTGKTSIILQLVQNSYFGQKAPSMSSSMEILARQVVGYHFCSMDNESTCTIPEFVHSLAAQITQNPNMSHFHKLVATSPHLQQLLSYPSCLSDPSKAFVEGLIEPLKLLRSQGKFPHQRSLILLDGLCEAEYHRSDNGDTLASFLKVHIPNFPNWLRVICTVRTNMMDIVKPFTFHRLSLDNVDNIDERLYKDMQDFVFQRIRESPFIQKNITPLTGKTDENHQSNLAHFLTLSSGGCFLYTDMVLSLFHEGKLQLKSSSLGMVPLSLSEIFLLEFNLRFPTQDSFSRVRDILSVCIASLRPMSLPDIWNCVNSLISSNDSTALSWEEFSARYQLVSWLLPKRADATVMFFHSTARDWLIGRRSIDSNKFLCDPRDGHAAIALYLSRRPVPLDPDLTLELGHHLLKANLFRRTHLLEGFSVRYLQAIWMATASKDPSRTLASPRNISFPNLKVSRLLLLAGASPDAVVDPVSQESLVTWYASQQNLEMIQLLSEFGANLNATNSAGVTALMVAAARGSVPIVQFLIDNGASLNTTDSKGSTALVFAARMGHLSIVSMLLSYDWPTSGCQLESTAQEALVISAREGHTDILETLLNNDRVKVNGLCPLSGESALCAAASAGKKDTCKLIIKRGGNATLPNRSGALPLHLAISDGHYAIVDLLLSSGIPVDQPDNRGRSPLLLAASVGQVGVLELLLARGANKDFKDSQGMNAICWAVTGNKHRALDLLLKQGLNIESADLALRTPLHHAASGSDDRIVEILLSNGSNVEAVDKDGIRPIDLAIGFSNEAAVMQMLKKGAKLGPTTWAMAKGKPRIALVLLNKLLEDGNTLFRHGRLKDAAYRYEYALKRLPRLKETCSGSTPTTSDPKDVGEDVFMVLKSHLLLNLSRTRRKEGNCHAAIDCASQVLSFRPGCFEAYWARAKAQKELKQLEGALGDLREAIKLSPQNMELHRFTMQVKSEIEGGQAPPPKTPELRPKVSNPGRDTLSSMPPKELESEV